MKKLSSILTALVMSVCIQSNAYATQVSLSEDFDGTGLEFPTLREILQTIAYTKDEGYTKTFSLGDDNAQRKYCKYNARRLNSTRQIPENCVIELIETIDDSDIFRQKTYRIYNQNNMEERFYFTLTFYDANDLENMDQITRSHTISTYQALRKYDIENRPPSTVDNSQMEEWVRTINFREKLENTVFDVDIKNKLKKPRKVKKRKNNNKKSISREKESRLRFSNKKLLKKTKKRRG